MSQDSEDFEESTPKRLTAKQAKFVEAYSGNATEAARKAGYGGDDATLAQVGYENMRKPEIRLAIRERGQLETEARIASRQERQIFWTSIMNDPGEMLAIRIKASELLGKSEADFTDKLDVTGKVTLADLVAPPDEKPKE